MPMQPRPIADTSGPPCPSRLRGIMDRLLLPMAEELCERRGRSPVLLPRSRGRPAMPAVKLILTAAALVALAGCGERAKLPVTAGMGSAPGPAEGLQVAAFAENLDHPRWLYVLPNGDVLVAGTNAPPRPKEGKG